MHALINVNYLQLKIFQRKNKLIKEVYNLEIVYTQKYLF